MRIGAMLEGERPLAEVVASATEMAEGGLHSLWVNQVFGHDALTLLAVVGAAVPRVELGTGVVPVYPRHPQVLAQQALTVHQVTGGRLSLGVGLSHQVVVEGLWGYRYEHPARFMREYLSALVPLLNGETVDVHGEMVTAVTTGPLEIEVPSPPPVLVAALGPAMLRTAGELTSGTVTWMTGVRTVESHIAPSINRAAAEAGRPAPRVVLALPVTVTSEPAQAKERIDRSLALYPHLPSYAAMLEREGVTKPSEIALVGSEEDLEGAVRRSAEAGATDLVAAVVGSREEQSRTRRALSALAAQV
jgi:5,10-methylenetetrahydromethanopterin reductase